MGIHRPLIIQVLYSNTMYIPNRSIVFSILASSSWLIGTTQSSSLRSSNQHPPPSKEGPMERQTKEMGTFMGGHGRIVNGDIAPRDLYPWFAAFDEPGCGGSLITSEFVLTAAHCVNSFVPGHVGEIRIGAYCGFFDPLDCTDPVTTETFTFGYNGVFVHPEYQSSSTLGIDHDFALIKLDGVASATPVEIDQGSVSPSYTDDKKLWAVGLGALYYGGDIPNELMHVNVSYVNNTVCKDQYNADPFFTDIIDDSMMCAADPNEDSCSGDSGGPLYDAENDVLVGVVSFGKECALPDFPGVYSRISQEFEWIQTVVCSRHMDESTRPLWCEGFTLAPTEAPTPAPTYGPICDDPSHYQFLLELSTDIYPAETSWDIKNSAGEIIFESEGYLETDKFVHRKCLEDPNDCYTYTIYDTYGDGLSAGGIDFTPGYEIFSGTEITGLKSKGMWDGTSFLSQSISFGDCKPMTENPTASPILNDNNEDGDEFGDTFHIQSKFPSTDDNNEWCIQPVPQSHSHIEDTLEPGADIVIRTCNDKSITQEWMHDAFGRIKPVKAPYLCITRAAFNRLELNFCGSVEDMDSLLIYNSFEDTILWMKDSSKVFTISSYIPKEDDSVVLAERDYSLQLQQWKIKF